MVYREIAFRRLRINLGGFAKAIFESYVIESKEDRLRYKNVDTVGGKFAHRKFYIIAEPEMWKCYLCLILSKIKYNLFCTLM